mgnify:CR=1 FL=1
MTLRNVVQAPADRYFQALLTEAIAIPLSLAALVFTLKAIDTSRSRAANSTIASTLLTVATLIRPMMALHLAISGLTLIARAHRRHPGLPWTMAERMGHVDQRHLGARALEPVAERHALDQLHGDEHHGNREQPDSQTRGAAHRGTPLPVAASSS